MYIYSFFSPFLWFWMDQGLTLVWGPLSWIFQFSWSWRKYIHIYHLKEVLVEKWEKKEKDYYYYYFSIGKTSWKKPASKGWEQHKPEIDRSLFICNSPSREKKKNKSVYFLHGFCWTRPVNPSFFLWGKRNQDIVNSIISIK